VVGRSFRRGWDAAGGYLKGAAILGVVEAATIGLTLFFVGSSLVAPVMIITFLAAFIPIVGAVAAGVIATLVALVTAGTVPALIVAGVAIVVQQLDNDLLAPVIYGKAIRLHPLVILLGIAAGGALFGFVGTFFAVPFLAVALNAVDELRRDRTADPTASGVDHAAGIVHR
jgi:predicted PurR-regulated permease PerM